jgi:hypothetical protein
MRPLKRLNPTGCGHGYSLGGVFLDLVAQGSDRNSENMRSPGPVAAVVCQRAEDKLALNLLDRVTDKRARERQSWRVRGR